MRAVVLRGAGPAFLAGGDVAFFHANLPRAAGIIREWRGELHHAILALRRAPKPVLASVHGAVAGAGVSLLAAADLAIAAADATFTLAYSRIGASPDGGATYFLPRLVGYRKALELMLLSDTFDAQAALRSRPGELGGAGGGSWLPKPRDRAAARAWRDARATRRPSSS